jgi:hypothetical protein
MTVGLSLLLIAIGAILRWAVTASVAGISLATVGLILLIVGVIGLVFALIQMAQAERTGTVPRDRAI